MTLPLSYALSFICTLVATLIYVNIRGTFAVPTSALLVLSEPGGATQTTSAQSHPDYGALPPTLGRADSLIHASDTQATTPSPSDTQATTPRSSDTQSTTPSPKAPDEAELGRPPPIKSYKNEPIDVIASELTWTFAVAPLANEPVVWVSMANEGFLPYALHFLKNLELLGLGHGVFPLIVACFDVFTVRKLSGMWPHLVYIGPNDTTIKEAVHTNLLSYGSKPYKRLMFAKLDILSAALQHVRAAGIPTLGYIDFDVTMTKDIRPLIAAELDLYPTYPLVTQCDETQPGPCMNTHRCPHMCGGLLLLRSSAADVLTPLMQYTPESMDAWPHTDQEFFEEALNKAGVQRGSLNRTLFPNGAAAHVNDEDHTIDELNETALVHFNYLIGDRKLHVMRKWKAWYGP